jgi:exodeoxyribonuclease VII small subunit
MGENMSESQNDGRTFEESLEKLANMVRELEEGRLGLEDALARYEQGVGLINSCYQQLQQAEQRILLLTGIDDEQQPILQPFKHEATAVTKKRP